MYWWFSGTGLVVYILFVLGWFWFVHLQFALQRETKCVLCGNFQNWGWLHVGNEQWIRNDEPIHSSSHFRLTTGFQISNLYTLNRCCTLKAVVCSIDRWKRCSHCSSCIHFVAFNRMSLDVNSNATNGWNCLRTLTAVNSSSANIHVPPVTRQLIPPGRHMFHPFNRVYPKPDQEQSDSDAKQPCKNPMRKTVDYYSSVIQMLEVQLRPTCLDPLVVDCIQSVIDYIQRRTWQRDLRDRPSLQPDVCYYPKLEPPSCYADTPSNAITTRLTKVGSLRS